MGWDIVEIGLKHDLPINNPMEVARIVSSRTGMNVRLYAQDMLAYDADANSVSSVEGYKEIEVGYFKANDTDIKIEMKACHYQALELIKELGEKGLKNLKFNDKSIKTYFNLDLPPFEYYELEYKGLEEDSFDVRIFKENIDLDVYINTGKRWSSFNYELENIDECKDIIEKYREQLHTRAKIFGCNQIIITCDQGPTIDIFDNLDMPSDKLLDFVNSRQYAENKDEYIANKEEMIHYNFQALLNNEETYNKDILWGAVFDDIE